METKTEDGQRYIRLADGPWQALTFPRDTPDGWDMDDGCVAVFVPPQAPEGICLAVFKRGGTLRLCGLQLRGNLMLHHDEIEELRDPGQATAPADDGNVPKPAPWPEPPPSRIIKEGDSQ